MTNKYTKGQISILLVFGLLIVYLFTQFGHSIDYVGINYNNLDYIEGFKEALQYFRNIIIKNPRAFITTLGETNTKAFFLYGIACFMLVAFHLLYYYKYKRNYTYKNIEHGSAEWEKLKVISSVASKDENNNFILSEKAKININGQEIRKNMNILVIGGSGSGKTRFFLKPNIMQMNTSYVITDPKGEILRDVGYMLKENGYKVRVLDLVDIKNSNRYNPFHYLDKDKEENVLTLITTIMNNTNDGKKGNDPFWESSERLLLQAIFFYILKVGKKEEQNIAMAMKLLTLINPNKKDSERDILDIMFERYEERHGYDTAIKCYKGFQSAAGKTMSSILISVNARLSTFLIGKIDKLMCEDELLLDKLGTEKTALFIITSVADTTFNSIASMVYTQLFQVLDYEANRNHGGSLPIQVRFLLDEFANLGKIPNFEKILAYARSLNIGIIPVFQSLGQLKEMYEKSYESIVDNCDTMVFLGGKGNTSTEYVSKMLGKATIANNTSNKSFSKERSVSINETVLGRSLMTDDEIARMDSSECLVFIKGLKPFKDKKFEITNHKNYKQSYGYDEKNKFIFKRDEKKQEMKKQNFNKNTKSLENFIKNGNKTKEGN